MAMFVILSSDRECKSKSVNAQNRALLKRYLKRRDYQFSLAEGYFEGVKEQAFVVEIDGLEELDEMRICAGLFDQDSIVFVCNDYGYLDVLDEQYMTDLGKLKTSLEKPEGNYTKVADFAYITFEE